MASLAVEVATQVVPKVVETADYVINRLSHPCTISDDKYAMSGRRRPLYCDTSTRNAKIAWGARTTNSLTGWRHPPRRRRVSVWAK